MQSHNLELKQRIAKYISHVFRTCDDKYLNELVLDRFLWTASEDNDLNERVKYKGQPYWSENAILLYQKNNTGKRAKNFSGLRHEHVMPRKLIKKMILDLEIHDEDKVLHILDTYLHAVIVTKEEDEELNRLGLNQTMPESFCKTGEILCRYKDANIQVIDVRNSDLKEIVLA